MARGCNPGCPRLHLVAEAAQQLGELQAGQLEARAARDGLLERVARELGLRRPAGQHAEPLPQHGVAAVDLHRLQQQAHRPAGLAWGGKGQL